MIYFVSRCSEKGHEVKTKKKKVTKASKKALPWRSNPEKWTDTLFDKKLIQNPSLMTNEELSSSIKEYLEWSRAKGKYDWEVNPITEDKEEEPPFSSEVWGRIMTETMVRLQITGEIALGRFKKNAYKD